MIILTVVCFILGLLGTLIPMLPGPFLVWLGIFLYGWAEGFIAVDLPHLLGQGFLLLLIFVVDWISSFIGIKKAGGSRASIIGAFLGLFLGLIFLGPLGIIVGPLAGGFLLEFVDKRCARRAFQVSLGSLLGYLGGTVAKLIIEIGMIGWFFYVI